MSDKIVSICIPTFNNAKYIFETIESVLTQTYQDLEIIIADDASEDRTVEILSTFNDPRIKIFRNNSNSGMTANWNRSISLASGDYIKLVCGDDILYPSCVERQVDALDKDETSAISLVTSYSDIINYNGKKVLRRKNLLKPGPNKSEDVIRKCMRFGTNLIGEPVVGMFRKASLKQGVKYDGCNAYMIDLDFWFQLLEKGSLYVINQYLAAFRVSRDSISSSLRFSQFQAVNKFIRLQRKKRKIKASDEFMGIISALVITVLRNLIFIGSSRRNSGQSEIINGSLY